MNDILPPFLADMLTKTRKRQADSEAEAIAPPAKRIADAEEKALLLEAWHSLCAKVADMYSSRSEVDMFFLKLKVRKADMVQLIKDDNLLVDLFTRNINDYKSLSHVIEFSVALKSHGVHFDTVARTKQVMSLLIDAPPCRDVSTARFEKTNVYSFFSWLVDQKHNPLLLYAHEVDGHPTTLVFEVLQGQQSNYPIHERAFFQFLIRRFGNPFIDIANNIPMTLIDFAVKALENHPSQLPISYPVLERVLFSIYCTHTNAVQWTCRTAEAKHVFSPDEIKQALTLIRQLCANPAPAIQFFNESVGQVNEAPVDMLVAPVKDMLDVDLLNSSEKTKVMYAPCGVFNLGATVWRRITDANLPYSSMYCVPRTDQVVARFVEEAPELIAKVNICKVPVALVPYVTVEDINDTEVVDYDWLKICKAIDEKLKHGRFQSLDEVQRYLSRMIQLDEEDDMLPRPGKSDGD